MEDEILKYVDWKTGGEREYVLIFGKGELSHLVCPFDKTPLIHTYDDWSNDVICVNCGEEFHANGGLTQEKLNETYKHRLEKFKEIISELERKRADLEARIKHGQEVGLLPKRKTLKEISESLDQEICSVTPEQAQEYSRQAEQDLAEAHESLTRRYPGFGLHN